MVVVDEVTGVRGLCVDVEAADTMTGETAGFPSLLPVLCREARVACFVRGLLTSFSWSLESMLVILFLLGVPGLEEFLDGLE